MCKQIFFLLLFPLALNAQQVPSQPALTDAALFFVDDANLSLTSAIGDTPKMRVLPDVPTPRTVPRDAENAVAAEAYQPTRGSVPPAKAPAITTSVWNKEFIAVHAAFLASIVYDAELTHAGLAHHKCVEGNHSLGTHPSRREIYGQNMLALGAIGGLDWIAAKARIRYLPYVTPVVGTVVHLTGGSKWLTECW